VATITSLMFRMNSTYNGDGLRQARSDISRLDGSMNALSKSSSSLVPGFKALVSSIIMLGPALIPISGGLLAIGGAAGSAFASAGAAVGIWAYALKGAINQTVGQNSAAGQTAKAMTNAQKAMDRATVGTKEYEKAQKTLTEATKAHEAALKGMPSVQENFARAYDDMKNSLEVFNDENAKFTLAPATTALQAFTTALPKFNKVIAAISPEIQRVADLTKKWVEGGGLDRFINFLVKNGVPALHGFIDATRSLLTALGTGMRAFAPLGQGFVDWLAKTMDAFSKWATGGGFERFLQWLADNKGALIGIAKDLGTTMGNLGKALGNMSGLALTNVGVLLKILAGFPPGLIQAIAYAWVAWNAALTIYNVVAFVAAAATTAMTLAATPFGLLMIGAAVTIGAVVLALIALGVGLFFLVKYWDTVWGAIKTAAKTVWDWITVAWGVLWTGIKTVAMAVWNWLTTGWGQLALFFMGPIGLFILVWKHWDVIWAGIQATASAVWGWLKTAWSDVTGWFSSTWDAAIAPVVQSWNSIWPGLRDSAKNIWAGISALWGLLWAGVTAAWSAFWNVFGPQIVASWQLAVSIITGLWNTFTAAWGVVWAAIQGIFSVAWAVLSGVWSVAWAALTGVAKVAWAALTGAWQVVWAVVTGIWNVFYATFSAIFSTAWNIIVAIVTGIWKIVSATWSALWATVTAVFNVFTAVFTGNWSGAWNSIKAAGQAIWNAITVAWQAVVNLIMTILNGFVTIAKAAWSAFWTAVQTVAMTFWTALRTLFQTSLTAVQTLWSTAWTAVRTVFQTIITAVQTIASAAWTAIRTGVSAFLTAVQNLWNTVWTTIRTFFGTIVTGLEATATGLWTSIRTVFSAGSTWLLNTFWNPVSNLFTKTIPAAFKAGADALGKAWDSIKNLVRAPIQAVVNVVYNDGIVSLWNTVAGVFGGKKLGKFTLPGFAEGGPTGNGPGSGFPALLHPNEHVWTSAEVKAAGGHSEVARLREMALGRKVRMMGGPNGRFDDGGGIIGAIGGSIKGAAGTVGNIAGDIGSVFNTVNKALSKVILGGVYEVIKPGVEAAVSAGKAAIRAAVPGSPGFEDVASGMAQKLGDTFLSWIKGKDVAPAGTGGTLVGKIPTGDHLKIIDAALAAAGVPPPGSKAQWEKGLNTLITRESAWNPNAINNWDSNAAAGMASRGLAQVIPPTFASNHVAGTSSNIFDPVANVAAAIRYITRRYGNITNVQQADASKPPQGYALGTPGANRGWATVGERGIERVNFRGGERVDPLTRLINDVSSSGSTIEAGAIQIDARGATPAAVDKLHREFPDVLRVALAQGVGKKP
jgi:phage-related protein